MRPRLAASEATQRAMQHLMTADAFLPELPAPLAALKPTLRWLLRAGVIRMLPRWQRNLANTHQGRITDMLIRPILRILFAVLARPKIAVFALELLSPTTAPIAAPALLGIPPLRDQTLTPAEAFKRHAIATPAQLYAQFKADQTTVYHAPSAPMPRENATPSPQPARQRVRRPHRLRTS